MALSSTRIARLTMVLLVIGVAAVAAAESGLQITPDERRTLVSKDVGAERWVITLNADDGTATGNVFFPGGGDPKFVACDQTASSEDALTFACAGADRCPLAPCAPDEWVPTGEVTIPRSFFQPRPSSTLATASGHAPASRQVVARLGSSVLGVVASRPSGLQVTQDGKRTLISKDVGTERWAITRNADDGSVTGNVFFPDGGEPKFVWCAQEGDAAADLAFSCYGADACGDTSCASEWSYIAGVQLPATFFAALALVRIEDLEVAILATLGSEDGFYGVVQALDRGYSLRQVLRAALSGRLRADGSVVTKTGGLEPPEGAAHGILTAGRMGSTAELPGVPRASSTPVPLISALRAKSDALAGVRGHLGLSVLISLTGQGYSFEQVVQAILLDQVRIPEGPGARAAFEIVDENGHWVVPDGPPIELVAPPGLPTPTPTPQPTATPVGEFCGNGIAGGDEECEGGNLRGGTCSALGFAGGTLRCTTRCTYDVTGCVEEPTCTGLRCPDGACVPAGADCCGGGRYCRPGSICVGGGQCCPVALPQLCGTLCIGAEAQCCGGYYCDPGFVCASGGCCPEGLPQPCPDGTCTIAGYVCCGGGTSCPPGTECAANGACE